MALSPPLSFSLLPGVGVGAASAECRLGVRADLYLLGNASLDLSSGLLQQEEKGLTLKPSSLLSPARYFSTYSSGFLSI